MAKRIVAVIGLLAMVAGVLQVFRPRSFWMFWEGLVYDRIVAMYALGLLSAVLGVFLLYVGIRKLARFATLIWIIGAISLLSGIIMIFGPFFYRDLMGSLFYFRPDGVKLGLSYIGGVVRFFIGVLLLIAGLSSPPSREEIRPEEPGAVSEQQD